eukprot:comp19647_c0_seq1/m.23235 comp19647_c0_seq1/g.23235  ORF comp19647_c0_seq1/g.23235 comp19647_c0_seq1/m.23235 type:complete len:311 (+) comp19647_c0_seq1:671-1603(+)
MSCAATPTDLNIVIAVGSGSVSASSTWPRLVITDRWRCPAFMAFMISPASSIASSVSTTTRADLRSSGGSSHMCGWKDPTAFMWQPGLTHSAWNSGSIALVAVTMMSACLTACSVSVLASTLTLRPFVLSSFSRVSANSSAFFADLLTTCTVRMTGRMCTSMRTCHCACSPAPNTVSTDPLQLPSASVATTDPAAVRIAVSAVACTSALSAPVCSSTSSTLACTVAWGGCSCALGGHTLTTLLPTPCPGTHALFTSVTPPAVFMLCTWGLIASPEPRALKTCRCTSTQASTERSRSTSASERYTKVAMML